MPQSPCKRAMNIASGRLPWQVILKTNNMTRRTTVVWKTSTVN